MTPSEHLRAAAALIADEKRWTHGVSARDARGRPCDPESSRACQRCAFGALWKILSGPSFWDVLPKFIELYGKSLPALNDHEGHAYTIGAMMHVADKLDGLA